MRKTAGTCLNHCFLLLHCLDLAVAGAVVGIYKKLRLSCFLLLAIAFFLGCKRDVIQ